MPDLAVIVVLGLAAFRATRLITNDSLTLPLRDRLYRFAWDDERTVAKDGYLEPSPRAVWRTYVHELFTCPYCLGVWIGACMYALWDHGGGVGETIVAIAAVIGVQAIAAHVTSLGLDDD